MRYFTQQLCYSIQNSQWTLTCGKLGAVSSPLSECVINRLQVYVGLYSPSERHDGPTEDLTCCFPISAGKLN